MNMILLFQSCCFIQHLTLFSTDIQTRNKTELLKYKELKKYILKQINFQNHFFV